MHGIMELLCVLKTGIGTFTRKTFAEHKEVTFDIEIDAKQLSKMWIFSQVFFKNFVDFRIADYLKFGSQEWKTLNSLCSNIYCLL